MQDFVHQQYEVKKPRMAAQPEEHVWIEGFSGLGFRLGSFLATGRVQRCSVL